MIGLAVAAVVVATLLLLRPPTHRALGRLDRRPVRRASWSRASLLTGLVPLAVGALSGCIALLASGGSADTGAAGTTAVAVAVAMTLVTGTGQWLVLCWRRQRRAQRAATDIAHGCRVLAGQLRIGLVPAKALEVAAQDCPSLRDGWTMHRLGGDVVRTWTEAGNRPGHDGLLALARAWQVSQDSGAPMADLLERASTALARERRVSGVLDSELAGPRATARLLALLPAAGVWLGIGLGGDPAGFLLHHPLGQVCLVVAVALACAGLVWVERIATSAGRLPQEGRDHGR